MKPEMIFLIVIAPLCLLLMGHVIYNWLVEKPNPKPLKVAAIASFMLMIWSIYLLFPENAQDKKMKSIPKENTVVVYDNESCVEDFDKEMVNLSDHFEYTFEDEESFQENLNRFRKEARFSFMKSLFPNYQSIGSLDIFIAMGELDLKNVDAYFVDSMDEMLRNKFRLVWCAEKIQKMPNSRVQIALTASYHAVKNIDLQSPGIYWESNLNDYLVDKFIYIIKRESSRAMVEKLANDQVVVLQTNSGNNFSKELTEMMNILGHLIERWQIGSVQNCILSEFESSSNFESGNYLLDQKNKCYIEQMVVNVIDSYLKLEQSGVTIVVTGYTDSVPVDRIPYYGNIFYVPYAVDQNCASGPFEGFQIGREYTHTPSISSGDYLTSNCQLAYARAFQASSLIDRLLGSNSLVNVYYKAGEQGDSNEERRFEFSITRQK